MLASATPFVDAQHRYHFTMPTVCRTAPAAPPVPAYAACGDGYAMVLFRGGSTSRAGLQALFDELTSTWRNPKLLLNEARGTLDGYPLRTIFAEGTDRRGVRVDLQVLAVAKDGGWYALTFSLPANEWRSDAPRYFVPIRQSFRFDRR